MPNGRPSRPAIPGPCPEAAHECLKNEEVQALIEKRQAPTLNKLETANITDAYVLGGIRGLITRIESYGLGAWQAVALTRLWEMLVKSVGLFKEKIEFGVDEVIMQKLLEGRERTRLAEVQALALPEGKEDGGNVH